MLLCALMQRLQHGASGSSTRRLGLGDHDAAADQLMIWHLPMDEAITLAAAVEAQM